MARQARSNSNRATAGGDSGTDIIIAGKQTKLTLAQKAGNVNYANMSKRARSLVESALRHYTPEAIENVLKNDLLENEFKKHGTIHGYAFYTMPLHMRAEIKDRLWFENTNYNGEEGKWSPILLEMKTRFDKEYRGNTMRYAYSRALDDFETIGGFITHLAVYTPSTQTVSADLTNPEFVRLIELHDNDPITPVISGKAGAGKSNFVLHTFRMAGILNKGYINPKYGSRSRVRAYLPNFDGSDNETLKNANFPGIPSSYSYRFPWQIFIDNPKGSSVFWTKYDWSMAQEEEEDDSAGIFSLVYLGELGLGALRYANSTEAGTYASLFQLTRQMRIRYYISSANPSPVPISLMEDFVNPQIWIDITESKSRVGTAEYLQKGQNGSPITVTKKIGTIPLDPLTKVLGKGIASDMTAAWEKFPLAEFMAYSQVTNMQKYLKDPDEIMNNATNFVLDFQDKYMEETFPEVMERKEKEIIPVSHGKIKPDKDDEEDNGNDNSFEVI